MGLDKNLADKGGCPGLRVGWFEFQEAEARALIKRGALSAGVCCHARPFLSVWTSNKWGDGRRTRNTCF